MACIDDEVIQPIKIEQGPLSSSLIIPEKASELKQAIIDEKDHLTPLKTKKKKKNKKKKKLIIIAQNKDKSDAIKRSKSAKKKKKQKLDKVTVHINRFSAMKHRENGSEATSLVKSLIIKQIPLKPLPQAKPSPQPIQIQARPQLAPIKKAINSKEPTTDISNLSTFIHLIEKEKHSLSVSPSKLNPIKEEPPLKRIATKADVKNSTSSVKFRSNYQERKNVFQLREEKGERIAQVRKEFSDKKFNQVNCYTYVIKQGNAAHLIKNCMSHRVNWKEPFSTVTSLFNFKWQQLSYGIDYPRLSKIASIKQVVNHYEYHSCLSNKSVMFINFLRYCEDNQLSVFKYAPLTIILKTDKPNTSFYKLFDSIKEYICDYDSLASSSVDNVKQPDNFCNWFPFEKEENTGLGLKTKIQIPSSHYQGKNLWVVKASNLNRGQCIRVVDSIEKIEALIKQFNEGIELGYDAEETDQSNLNEKKSTSAMELNQSFNQIPNETLTQIITPNQVQALNQTMNLNQFKQLTAKLTSKPNDTQSQGLNKTARLDSKQEQSSQLTQANTPIETKKKVYQSNRIIIQKYIENPFLYRGRKCDMRIWVLITHKMKVFIFREGHLKTCSVNYDVNNNDSYVHITNYSFQKHSTQFGKFEDGNEVPFSDLQKFLEEQYSHKHIQLGDILDKIKKIIHFTTKSVHSKINKLNRSFSFEIFGYDFMLDNDFNVFLIEINTNPGLEESSLWIKTIVPRMLDDALRLTIDQIFDTKYCFDLIKKEEAAEQMQITKREEIERMLANTIPLNECNREEDYLENISSNKSLPKAQKESNEDASPITALVKSNAEHNNSVLKVSIHKPIASTATTSVNEKKTEVTSLNPNETLKPNKSYEIIDNRGLVKYKSPFPVNGYDDNDNLWEFICELNEEAVPEKEKDSYKLYAGIRHLLKQKTKAKR